VLDETRIGVRFVRRTSSKVQSYIWGGKAVTISEFTLNPEVLTVISTNLRLVCECARNKGKTRLLLVCSAFSLDAPAVATIWLLLFANCFHLAVPAATFTALFGTVWLIYLVDRFADSLCLTSEMPRSARQMFCARNRNLWLALISIVGLVDAAIVCFALDRIVVLRGIFLGLIVAAYLAINWSWSKIWTVLPFKETIVGSLFAAGTLLALSPRPASLPLGALIAGGLFATLCFANCVSIACWERELDRIQNKHSIATHFGRMLRLRDLLSGALAAGSLCLIMIDREIWSVSVCIAVSSIATIVLNKISVSRDERCALADLVLLSPAVFMAIRSLR
jgi:hypothetical protein